MSDKKNLYRYIDAGESMLSYDYVCLSFEIIRETEKSYFIRTYDSIDDSEKSVPKNGGNLFAFTTREAALENYYQRKLSQNKHLYRATKANEVRVRKLARALKRVAPERGPYTFAKWPFMA